MQVVYKSLVHIPIMLKELYVEGMSYILKKGYYSNKKKSLVVLNKKWILTKKRNLINLNTRECSKKLNHKQYFINIYYFKKIKIWMQAEL